MSYYAVFYHIIYPLTISECQWVKNMFINKSADGSNNLCGKKIALFREQLKISQRELADRMQLVGIDVNKNAIQRIECGKRFVTDIEVVAFAKVFQVSVETLLDE